MTAIEFLQVLTSSGVFAGGLGLLKWGLTVERRLLKCEMKSGINT